MAYFINLPKYLHTTFTYPIYPYPIAYLPVSTTIVRMDKMRTEHRYLVENSRDELDELKLDRSLDGRRIIGTTSILYLLCTIQRYTAIATPHHTIHTRRVWQHRSIRTEYTFSHHDGNERNLNTAFTSISKSIVRIEGCTHENERKTKTNQRTEPLETQGCHFGFMCIPMA